ncbi:Aste57867_24899 [Aphanomyces stellatus]|uniref:Aste57867_24899 protein n=1 Tax=Aphanomyces stellatus TaxID=120398 RepID=A0A485LT39_9STRA|nr:hypothetical protein As57867_024821 [Aphanomyces stellatus]VFU01533.1 Aste57867_24899 [Aphanomyces stellatus]
MVRPTSSLAVIAAILGSISSAYGVAVTPCPKETPCSNGSFGPNPKCGPGDASKSNGAGLVWCGTSRDTPWCANPDACYDYSTKTCVCTGAVPCKYGSTGECSAFDSECARGWSTYCPSGPAPTVAGATTTKPTTTAPTTTAPTTTAPTTTAPTTTAPTPVAAATTTAPTPTTSTASSSTGGTDPSTASTTKAPATTLATSDASTAKATNDDSPGSSVGYIVAGAGGALVLVGLIAFFVARGRHRRRHHKDMESPRPFHSSDPTPVLPLPQEKRHATTASSSSSANVLDLNALEMYRISLADLDLSHPRAVGRGGFGQVVLAEFGGDVVAVKSILPSMKQDKRAVANFIAEVKLLAKCGDCDYIVRFLGAHWTRPVDMMLVMEWMDRGDLDKYLANTTPLSFPFAQKLSVAHDVIEALVYIHSMNVIHRDLKASNVLLNAAMRAKLTDFGISREFDYDDTMTAGAGTLHWMAPEVANGDRHYDASADMYSFGVLLVALEAHTAKPRVRPGQVFMALSPEAPSWYRDLVQRCLSPTPAARPSSMQVSFAIQKALRDQASAGHSSSSKHQRSTHGSLGDHTMQSDQSFQSTSHQPRHTTTQSSDSQRDDDDDKFEAMPPTPNEDPFDLTPLAPYRIEPMSSIVVSRDAVGKGGFGAVFYGTWHGADVAVKRLLPEKEKDLHAVADFIAEIKLLASVQSEYIVAFKGAAWTRPVDIMLVMEWMEEGDLDHFLQTHRPADVEWRHRLQIAHDVAHALGYLHGARNIIHRDLKTRNVLLSPSLRAKLTDFGISRQAAAADKSMTARIGTKNWMAPEVQRGGRYDKSADMYAFGVLLFLLDTHDAAPHAMTGKSAPEFESFRPEKSTGRATAFSAHAPHWYIDLSRQCVVVDPKRRPSARQAALLLEQKLEEANGTMFLM